MTELRGWQRQIFGTGRCSCWGWARRRRHPLGSLAPRPVGV